MSSKIAREIVDSIESGNLNDAKGQIHQGIKEKAAEAVDMKRVGLQVDWMSTTSEPQGM